MVNGTDFGVLQTLAQLGGKAHVQVVARKAGLRTPYAELICNSLAKHGYIGVATSGMCALTEKGHEVLRKKGWRSEDRKQGEEIEPPRELIGAERFLRGLRQRLRAGKMTKEEYQQKRAKILVEESQKRIKG